VGGIPVISRDLLPCFGFSVGDI